MCIELNRKTSKQSTFLYISLGNRHQNGNTFLRQDRFVIYLFTVQRYSALYKNKLTFSQCVFLKHTHLQIKLPACVQLLVLQAIGLVTKGLPPKQNPQDCSEICTVEDTGQQFPHGEDTWRPPEQAWQHPGASAINQICNRNTFRINDAQAAQQTATWWSFFTICASYV